MRADARALHRGYSAEEIECTFRWWCETTVPLPEDLMTLQRAWQQAYAELAQAPAGAGTTALRRRLIALSGTLFTHPHWTTPAACWSSSP